MDMIARAMAKQSGSKSKFIMLEEVTDFSTLPSGWENSGWTLGGGKASYTAVSTPDYSHQLRTGKKYGLSKRIMRWEFEIDTTGAIIAFLTYPTEGALYGSMIRIDSGNNYLQTCAKYTGTGEPATTNHALGFTMATGTRYVFEMEKVGRSIKTRIWNKEGKDFFETAVTASVFGYSTYPSHDCDIGVCQGQPGVAMVSGSASIYYFSHRAIGNENPILYICGDSITEGYCTPEKTSYAEILETIFGNDEVYISGCGGSTIEQALSRVTEEIGKVRPKYAIVFFGTNSETSFAANLATLIANIKSAGAKPLVCTIPSNASTTAVVKALTETTINIDLAMTDSGAGSTAIEAYYTGTDTSGASYSDGMHPNSAGHKQIVYRLKMDYPVLFANTNVVNNIPIAPQMTGLWHNYGSGFDTAKYTKNGNVVTLQGLLQGNGGANTQGTVIFNLPVGYRPPADILCATIGSDYIGAIKITSDGVVSIWKAYDSQWISLSGISFVVG